MHNYLHGRVIKTYTRSLFSANRMTATGVKNLGNFNYTQLPIKCQMFLYVGTDVAVITTEFRPPIPRQALQAPAQVRDAVGSHLHAVLGSTPTQSHREA